MAVYLIHFDRPLQHAQHYLGYAQSVDERIERHRSGSGAKILAECNRLGIPWDVVRVWQHADRNFESKLKKAQHNRRLCPVCCKRPRNPEE